MLSAISVVEAGLITRTAIRAKLDEASYWRLFWCANNSAPVSRSTNTPPVSDTEGGDPSGVVSKSKNLSITFPHAAVHTAVTVPSRTPSVRVVHPWVSSWSTRRAR